MISCLISKSEEKTRKHWLLSSVCCFIFHPLAVGALFAVLSIGLSIPEDFFIGVLIEMLGGLFFLLVIWHCAYRKCGTKLLSFYLFGSSAKGLASMAKNVTEADDGCLIAFAVLDIVFFVWWCLMSWKLRKVNKSIQGRKSLIPQI